MSAARVGQILAKPGFIVGEDARELRELLSTVPRLSSPSRIAARPSFQAATSLFNKISTNLDMRAILGRS